MTSYANTLGHARTCRLLGEHMHSFRRGSDPVAGNVVNRLVSSKMEVKITCALS
jgi:hypothetical protein